MNPIDTAIILAAGEGSRLRDRSALKPLCRVAGETLIARAIDGLAAAGIARVICVLGYAADTIEAAVSERSWPVQIELVRAAGYQAGNGASLLAARPALGQAEALLVMCDHVVEPELYRRVAEAGAGEGLRLAVDRTLRNDWVDLDDVTRVRTDGDAIAAIGKGLDPYDCFDTGVFAIGPALFDALAGMAAPSLTDGVRALAARGAARTLDCTGLRWIDVDDAAALTKAELWLA